MPIDLKHLRELEAAALTSPWDIGCLSEGIRHLFRNVDHEDYCSKPREEHLSVGKYDGEFIATMRNALPALLSELEAYREMAEEVRGTEVEDNPTEICNEHFGQECGHKIAWRMWNNASQEWRAQRDAILSKLDERLGV